MDFLSVLSTALPGHHGPIMESDYQRHYNNQPVIDRSRAATNVRVLVFDGRLRHG